MGTRSLPTSSQGHAHRITALIAWLLWLAVTVVLALTLPDSLAFGGAWGVLWVVLAVTWGWLGFIGLAALIGGMLRRLVWRHSRSLRPPVPPVGLR